MCLIRSFSVKFVDCDEEERNEYDSDGYCDEHTEKDACANIAASG